MRERAAALVFASFGLISSVAPAQPRVPRAPVAWASCGQQQADLSYWTDVNAQSANGGLAAGVSKEGRISVFRWPHPSFYDQVKYLTYDVTKPHMGALPNEGVFFGLAIRTAAGSQTSWLDATDWAVSQRFISPDSDAVETTYRRDDLGLSAVVTDVVEAGRDVLRRRVSVSRDVGSPVLGADAIAFENFNLVVSKIPMLPTQDWCQEEENTDTAEFAAGADAIVHTKDGVDMSTGESSSAAVAMGLVEASSGHQVGGDAYEPAASPDGKVAGPTQDAYDDAADGTLRGNAGPYIGQTTGALLAPLAFSNGSANAEVIIAAAAGRAGALTALGQARETSFTRALARKSAWLAGLLAGAPLPNTANAKVTALAKRGLITALTDYDRSSGAVVASITAQGPYGEDWIRDGAFINHALDIAGLADLVGRHQVFYAETQSKPDRPPRGTPPGLVPPGNWNMMYYADGVAGGPIPWEIDETAFGAWTFWDHYTFTRDRTYLEAVWPSIKLAADFLVLCRDPSNGLQCNAVEDDTTALSQTLHGAGTVWLALDSAAKAARTLGRWPDAATYGARRDELGATIVARFWDGSSFGGGSGAGSWLIWPERFLPYSDPRMQAQADYVWQQLAPSFDGSRSSGAYEAKGLLALGKIWAGDETKLQKVRAGLEWIAEVQATPGTGVLGESWVVMDGAIVTKVSQPHVWEQILFYLASLDAYGRA